jgi:hypothetical protein
VPFCSVFLKCNFYRFKHLKKHFLPKYETAPDRKLINVRSGAKGKRVFKTKGRQFKKSYLLKRGSEKTWKNLVTVHIEGPYGYSKYSFPVSVPLKGHWHEKCVSNKHIGDALGIQ